MRLLLIRAAALLLVTSGLALAQEQPPAEGAPPRTDGSGAPAQDRPGPSGGVAPAGPDAGGRAGHGSVEARVGYYHNDDSARSNPFLDEEETVIEPVIVFSYDATDRLSLGLTTSYDYVSSASIDRLSRYPEQSGASADNYFGADVSARYRITDQVRIGATGGASFEYDYDSLRFGADVAVDLFEKTTTLSLGVMSFLDTVQVIRWNGVEDGDESRTTVSVTAGWYQVLSPTVHLDLGYTLTHQSGFLETAYNSVVLEDPNDQPNPMLDNQARGVEVTEELPDTRLRHALYGEVRKYFDTGTSVGLGGRIYLDSWGVFSQSLEVRVYQWVVKDVLHVRGRYRFYNQLGADDYQDHFFIPPGARAQFVAREDRTQDSDLGDFTAHTVGLAVTWQIVDGHRLEASVDYVLRSDGLDQVLLGFGYRWDF